MFLKVCPCYNSWSIENFIKPAAILCIGVVMQSAIIFLGTGAGSLIRSKQIRATGGIILRFGDNQFHLDPGPGALVRAKEFSINFREHTALLASHNHLSHAGDINAVLDAMSYAGLDKKGVLAGNETVINGTQNIKPFLLEPFRNMVEKVITLSRHQKMAINDIEIKALHALHTDPEALGFKFFTPEFILSYSGDTGYAKDIADQYEGSDILILNVKNVQASDDNLGVEDAVKIIQDTEPRLAIITHFSHKMIEADPIYLAREIQKATKVQTIAAKDGMLISPAGYSSKVRQVMKQY